jgi:hypothetical protein
MVDMVERLTVIDEQCSGIPDNESKVYMNLYDDIIHDRSPRPTPNYAVGDTVRITKKQ